MKFQHTLSKEFKLEQLGPGEWIEEPDFVSFSHEEFQCEVVRNGRGNQNDPDSRYVSGILCGYVKIPEGHPWYGKDIYKDKFHCDIHGGLTYAEMEENEFWIGFDCGHGCDIVPIVQKIFLDQAISASTENIQRKNLQEITPAFFGNSTYKNIDYAIGQCYLLANQAKEVKIET